MALTSRFATLLSSPPLPSSTERAGEEVADEAKIILVAHHLARAREAVGIDDLLPQREAEVVRVDRERGLLARGVGPDHVGVRLDRREVEILRQEVGLAQEPRVPVRRPALVHDLTGEQTG